jgi:hypothetical protein
MCFFRRRVGRGGGGGWGALGWEQIQMKGINCDLLSSNYSAFLCFSRLGFQLFFVGHKIAYEAWLTV